MRDKTARCTPCIWRVFQTCCSKGVLCTANKKKVHNTPFCSGQEAPRWKSVCDRAARFWAAAAAFAAAEKRNSCGRVTPALLSCSSAQGESRVLESRVCTRVLMLQREWIPPVLPGVFLRIIAPGHSSRFFLPSTPPPPPPETRKVSKPVANCNPSNKRAVK